MGEGLDLAIVQVKALEFLNNVADEERAEGGIFSFREKIKEGEFLRTALISHLCNLFRLSEEEAEEVIDKFLGGIVIL